MDFRKGMLSPTHHLSPAFTPPAGLRAADTTIFNLTPCDNDFEKAFAKILDGADDIERAAKPPLCFGFTIEYLDDAKNLRLCSPDFVAVDSEEVPPSRDEGLRDRRGKAQGCSSCDVV